MPANKARLTAYSICATFSVLCWLLLLTALASTTSAGWGVIGRYKAALISLGQPTHTHCWLCGMTRAFRCICLGKFREASAYNDLSPLLFGVIIVGCLLPPVYLLGRRITKARTESRTIASTLRFARGGQNDGEA